MRPAPQLSRQPLAALSAATGKHPLATDGLHTLAEAMTPFAHKTAGLIRAFHGNLRRDGRPNGSPPTEFRYPIAGARLTG